MLVVSDWLSVIVRALILIIIEHNNFIQKVDKLSTPVLSWRGILISTIFLIGSLFNRRRKMT